MPATPATSQPPRAIGVLTVDDQAIFRAAARDVIDATPGFESVGEVASGLEALAASDALRPDLVLMDVRMPGIDGIEAARQLRARRPETVIVLVSVEEGDEMDAAVQRCGAVTFIRKQKLRPDVLARVWASHGRH